MYGIEVLRGLLLWLAVSLSIFVAASLHMPLGDVLRLCGLRGSFVNRPRLAAYLFPDASTRLTRLWRYFRLYFAIWGFTFGTWALLCAVPYVYQFTVVLHVYMLGSSPHDAGSDFGVGGLAATGCSFCLCTAFATVRRRAMAPVQCPAFPPPGLARQERQRDRFVYWLDWLVTSGEVRQAAAIAEMCNGATSDEAVGPAGGKFDAKKALADASARFCALPFADEEQGWRLTKEALVGSGLKGARVSAGAKAAVSAEELRSHVRTDVKLGHVDACAPLPPLA